MAYTDKIVYCAICGCKIIIPVIVGNDNRIYIRLFNNWIRIKTLDMLFIACNECILKERLLEEKHMF